jgi:hypothetical protein
MILSRRRDALKTASAAAATSLLPGISFGAIWLPRNSDEFLVDGEAPRPAKDSFTIAVLPDTHYSEKFPEQYMAQTRWIAESCNDRRTACVLHLGDITNRNTPVAIIRRPGINAMKRCRVCSVCCFQM